MTERFIGLSGDLPVLWNALIAANPVDIETNAGTLERNVTVAGWDNTTLYGRIANAPVEIGIDTITVITIHPRN